MLKSASKEATAEPKGSTKQLPNANTVVDLEADGSPLQSCRSHTHQYRAPGFEGSLFKESEARYSLPEAGISHPPPLHLPHQQLVGTSSTKAPINVGEIDPYDVSPVSGARPLPTKRPRSWRSPHRTAANYHEELQGAVQNAASSELGVVELRSGLSSYSDKGKLWTSSSKREDVLYMRSKHSKEKSVIVQPVALGSPDCQLIGSSSFKHGQGSLQNKRSSFGTSASRPSESARISQAMGSSRHACQGAGTRGPIDVDEAEASEVVHIDIDMELQKLRQMEQDEMLAKLLQEEFSFEGLGGDPTDDEQLAWMLQEEENTCGVQNARRLSLTPSSSTAQANTPAMQAVRREMQGALTSATQSRAGRSSSALSTRMRIMRNMQNRTYSRQQVRGHRLGGRGHVSDVNGSILRFPDGLDLDTRLEILAVMESAVQGANPLLEHVERDFNENDYEMLLSLDDANHEHTGASLLRIEQLPVSVIKPSDVYEETCSICLDVPTVDERVRRLPCMHGFHQQCIDVWLGRQASCPICKVSI